MFWKTKSLLYGRIGYSKTASLHPVDGLTSRMLGDSYAKLTDRKAVLKEIPWILKQLVKKGAPIGTMTFTTAISIVGYHNTSAAMEIRKLMKQCDIIPDIRLIDSMLNISAREPKIFTEIEIERQSMNYPVTRVYVYAKLKNIARVWSSASQSLAIDVLENAVNHAIEVDVRIYNQAILCSKTLVDIDYWWNIIKKENLILQGNTLLSFMRITNSVREELNRKEIDNDDLCKRMMTYISVGKRNSLLSPQHLSESSKTLRSALKYEEAEKLWRSMKPNCTRSVSERLTNIYKWVLSPKTGSPELPDVQQMSALMFKSISRTRWNSYFLFSYLRILSLEPNSKISFKKADQLNRFRLADQIIAYEGWEQLFEKISNNEKSSRSKLVRIQDNKKEKVKTTEITPTATDWSQSSDWEDSINQNDIRKQQSNEVQPEDEVSNDFIKKLDEIVLK